MFFYSKFSPLFLKEWLAKQSTVHMFCSSPGEEAEYLIKKEKNTFFLVYIEREPKKPIRWADVLSETT